MGRAVDARASAADDDDAGRREFSRLDAVTTARPVGVASRDPTTATAGPSQDAHGRPMSRGRSADRRCLEAAPDSVESRTVMTSMPSASRDRERPPCRAARASRDRADVRAGTAARRASVRRQSPRRSPTTPVAERASLKSRGDHACPCPSRSSDSATSVSSVAAWDVPIRARRLTSRAAGVPRPVSRHTARQSAPPCRFCNAGPAAVLQISAMSRRAKPRKSRAPPAVRRYI